MNSVVLINCMKLQDSCFSGSICFSKVSHSPHTMKYFSQIHVEPLLGPLEIILSEVCSYSQIEHSRVTMNMKLSSHGFLFHGNINERESKA